MKPLVFVPQSVRLPTEAAASNHQTLAAAPRPGTYEACEARQEGGFAMPICTHHRDVSPGRVSRVLALVLACGVVPVFADDPVVSQAATEQSASENTQSTSDAAAASAKMEEDVSVEAVKNDSSAAPASAAPAKTQPVVVVHNAGTAAVSHPGRVRISMPGRVAVYHNAANTNDDSGSSAADQAVDVTQAQKTVTGAIVIPSNTLLPAGEEPLWMARERQAREQDRADLIAEGVANSYAPTTYTTYSARYGGLGWDGIGWTYFPDRRGGHHRPPRVINPQPRPIPTDDLTERNFGAAQREFNRATRPAKVTTDPKTGLWVQEP